MNIPTPEQLRARTEEMRIQDERARKQAYEVFMARPATRLLISIIPAAEHRDTLTALIADAFETGWGSGGAATVAAMMQTVLRASFPK
jgi:hypothetical protein